MESNALPANNEGNWGLAMHIARCSLLDLVVLLVVDNLILSLLGQSSSRQRWLRWIETLVLVLVALVMFFIHHVPVLLLLAIGFLFTKASLALFSTIHTVRESARSAGGSPVSFQRKWGSESYESGELKYQGTSHSPYSTAYEKESSVENQGSYSGLQRRAMGSAPLSNRGAPAQNSVQLLNENEKQCKMNYISATPGYVQRLTGRAKQYMHSVSTTLEHWNVVHSPIDFLHPSSPLKSQNSPNVDNLKTSVALKQPPPAAPSCLSPVSFKISSSKYMPSNSWHSPGVVQRHNDSHFPPGMPNRGRNLCFMNSILQSLARCPGILEDVQSILENEKPGRSTELRQFLSESILLLSQCKAPGKGQLGPAVMQTVKFSSALSGLRGSMVVNPEKSLYQQQQCDASEFLLWLLDAWDAASGQRAKRKGGKNLNGPQVHSFLRKATSSGLEELPVFLQQLHSMSLSTLEKLRSCCYDILHQTKDDINLTPVVVALAECQYLLKPMLPVQRLVTSQLVAARQCQRCWRTSVSAEPARILAIPIVSRESRSVSLTDCLGKLSRVEHLTDSGAFQCPCQSVDKGVCRELVRQPPSLVILQLLRFNFNQNVQAVQKLVSPIAYPVTGLSLEPALFEVQSHLPRTQELYNLCAVCVHTGSMSAAHGHYFAYAREADGSWYLFDDEKVTPVANMEAEVQSPVLLRNSYLLFYAKQSRT